MANAVGPLAVIYFVIKTGHVGAKVPVPVSLLAFGGIGIALGIITFGHKVIETVGFKITQLTNTRGFSIDISTATTILLASKLGLPVSTTHAAVGAVIGIGLAKGFEAVDLKIIVKIIAYWLITLPVVALTGMAIFKILQFCQAKSLNEIYHLVKSKNREMKNIYRNLSQGLQKVLIKFWHDHCFERAGTLTYVTILSLVPITTISFSILGRFKLSEPKIRTFLLKYFLPESSLVSIIESNIEKFIQNATTLSIISTIALLFISFAVLSMIEATFNLIWRVQKRRSYFNKFVSFWAVITVTPLLLGTSLGFITKIEHFSFSPLLISFLLSTTGLFFLYRLFPYTEVSIKAGFVGSAIASILFEICKWGFRYYIHYYASFDKIYGALSIIPIFLVWLYWVWVIVLLGAEIAFICDYPYYIPPRQETFQYNPMWPIFILLKIMHNVQKEKRRLNNRDLAQRLNLPLETINSLTALLAERGWIIRNENKTWAPNCPLEKLSLREIFSINKNFTKIDGASDQKIGSLWRQLEVCLNKEWGKITLGELIEHER